MSLIVKQPLPPAPPQSMALGTAFVEGAPVFSLPLSLLKTHMAVFGGTGRGKSKLLELLCQEFVRYDLGFCLIDPHGDTSEDVAAYIGEYAEKMEEVDTFWKLRVHYLQPTTESLFSFDPFHYRESIGTPGSTARELYLDWISSQTDRVKRVIIRQQGEGSFEGMPRLSRWLGNVCYACGVAYDAKGTHLGLDKALPLLDPFDTRHTGLFETVAPHLPQDILADFRRLQKYQRQSDVFAETESSINRLRAFLSRAVGRIVSQRAPSIDFRAIIRQNGIVLCNLRETDHLSSDQGDALGGLIISEILSQARVTEREDRKQFHLMIDEAERYIGEDMRKGFAELRKMLLSLIIAVQDLECLERDELSLLSKVLGMCGVKATFQQQFHEDAEVLARTFGWKNLDFTELMQTAFHPDGYDWVDTESVSESEGTGTSRSSGGSTMKSRTHTQQQSLAESQQRNWSQSQTVSTSFGLGLQVSAGINHTAGESVSEGGSSGTSNSLTLSHAEGETEGSSTGTQRQDSHSRNENATHPLKPGVLGSRGEGSMSGASSGTSNTETRGRNTNDSVAVGRTVNNGSSWSQGATSADGRSLGAAVNASRGRAEGEGKSEGGSAGRTVGESEAESVGEGEGENWSAAESAQRGRSVTRGKTPLARQKQVQEHTGRLQRSVDDQMALMIQQLMTLRVQHCVVSISDLPFSFLMRVLDLPDPFADAPMWRIVRLLEVRDSLCPSHPYMFRPAVPVPTPDPVATPPKKKKFAD